MRTLSKFKMLALCLSAFVFFNHQTLAETTTSDIIRQQISKCWKSKPASGERENTHIEVSVNMNIDGTVSNAGIKTKGYQSNPLLRSLANRSLRSVLNPRCQPFNLPRNQYEEWKVITLLFNSKGMVGTAEQAIQKPFGAILGGAQVQAAKKEWQKVSKDELECVSVATKVQETSIEELIKKGIKPTHNALQGIFKTCRTIYAQFPLATDVPCTLTDTNGGHYQSRCNKSFFVIENGEEKYISRDTALQFVFLGRAEEAKYGERETEAGLKTRLKKEPNLTTDQKKAIQVALKKLGFYSSTVDGDFGERTRSAIKKYQRSNGNNASGYLATAQANDLINHANRFVSQQNTPEEQAAKPSVMSDASAKLAQEEFKKGDRAYARGNFKEAVKWYRKAAERGMAEAQYSLGERYTFGEGVPKDHVEATKWYRRAVEQGNANAEYNLGVNYDNGLGVPKNVQEAIKLFNSAAKRGNSDAQYVMGVVYFTGKGGTTKNRDKAYKWFVKAEKQGHARAKDAVTEMIRDNRKRHFAKKGHLYCGQNVNCKDKQSVINAMYQVSSKLSAGPASQCRTAITEIKQNPSNVFVAAGDRFAQGYMDVCNSMLGQ